MADDDEMVLSLNGKSLFDIDFETAYTNSTGLAQQKEDFFNYWHPCYKINVETVPN